MNDISQLYNHLVQEHYYIHLRLEPSMCALLSICYFG